MPSDDLNPVFPSPIPSQPDDPAFALTLPQQFETATMKRAIDSSSNIDELRSIAKQLLDAWQTQKAATRWVIAQQTGWRANGLQNHPADH